MGGISFCLMAQRCLSMMQDSCQLLYGEHWIRLFWLIRRIWKKQGILKTGSERSNYRESRANAAMAA